MPTAATTTTPSSIAKPTAAASSGEKLSSAALRGSRSPPRLMLITRAPLRTAQRIAFASASMSIVPSAATTLATRSSTAGAMPAMPSSLFTVAAITPETNVPWPWVSCSAEVPTKLFQSAIRPWNSGWPPSIPESITATSTRGRTGRSGQYSKALVAARCHCCFWASGSFGVNAGRREPSRST